MEGQPERRANVATGTGPSTEGQQASETNSFGPRRRHTGIANVLRHFSVLKMNADLFGNGFSRRN